MAHVNRRIGKSSEIINTADGTGGILDAFIHDYFQRSGNVGFSPGESPSGITASGGVVNDGTSSENLWAHTFTSSGTFSVRDETSNFGSTVEYVVVAGGGSGPHENGGGAGGGGAGGYRLRSG